MNNYSTSDTLAAYYLHSSAADNVPINELLIQELGLREAFLLAEIQRRTVLNPESNYHIDGHQWTQISFAEIEQKYPCVGKKRKIIQMVNKLVEEGFLIKAPAQREDGGTDKNLYRVDPREIARTLLKAQEKSQAISNP